VQHRGRGDHPDVGLRELDTEQQIVEGAVIALRGWLTEEQDEANKLFRESMQQVYPALARGIVFYQQDMKGFLCVGGRLHGRASRSRERRTPRRRAAMRSSARSGDSGDDPPGSSPLPLRLAPKPGAIYTYGVRAREEWGLS
jgi:hypothetical protein